MASLDGLLDHLNAVVVLEGLEERTADFHVRGSEDTSFADSTIKHLLNSNSSGNTNGTSHSGVSTRDTELAESRSTSLLLTVLVLNAELVLQHDHVTLVRLVLHLPLQSSAQGVKRVTTGSDLLVGEEADPAETAEDTVALLVVGERGLGRDRPGEILLARRSGAQDLAGSLLPGDGGVEEVSALIAQEADVDEALNHLREALVAQSAADDSLGFGDLVVLAEGGGVAVGVAEEGEARVDEVGLGGGHELGAVDRDGLAVLVELGGVAEGEEHAAAGPGELVAQGVVGVFGGGETTAVRQEGVDLAALGVDLVSLVSSPGLLIEDSSPQRWS